ncbi:proteasome inhibitor PI31 subunit-like, partial [Tropilaelaps mercedesae]
MAAPDFGLEALYRLHPVNSKTNAVIVLVHFVLTKNGLLHVGRGIYWENDEIGSEMLPADWEQSDREYRYVSRADPKKRFILTFSGPETVLLVRMVHVKQKVTTSICVDTEKHVDGTQLASNTPRLIFPKLFDLMAQISNELLDEHQAATCSIGTSAPSSNPRGPSYEPGGPPNISRNPDINPLFHEEV